MVHIQYQTCSYIYSQLYENFKIFNKIFKIFSLKMMKIIYVALGLLLTICSSLNNYSQNILNINFDDLYILMIFIPTLHLVCYILKLYWYIVLTHIIDDELYTCIMFMLQKLKVSITTQPAGMNTYVHTPLNCIHSYLRQVRSYRDQWRTLNVHVQLHRNT